MIKIEAKDLCCGCWACIQRCPQQCISMQEDLEGFLYPSVDTSLCINCGLCEKVCPTLNQNVAIQPLKVYAAKNPDDKIRMESSSGGVFTLFAEKVISQNGIVFGARFDDQWNVIHDYADTRDGLSVFRGSKYVQSQIRQTYLQAEQFLKLNKLVLFSGTPCQIAGLKCFLRKEYENLITIEVVCHGVPSPKIWQKYLKSVMQPTLDISQISMRDKSTGWETYSMHISSQNHEIVKEYAMDNIYMQGFLSDLYIRPSCYSCPTKRLKTRSDITIGDYWGISQYHPKFYDKKGISLIIINTPKGQKIYNQIKADEIESTLENAISKNPAIIKNANCPLLRQLFWSRFHQYGIIAIQTILREMRPSIVQRYKHFAYRLFNRIFLFHKI